MKTTAQKRKEARDERAADPYAYQRSQERKAAKNAHKKPKKKDLPEVLRDSANGAVLRMKLYLATHPQQMDHDRDMVLLDIHRMLRELTGTH